MECFHMPIVGMSQLPAMPLMRHPPPPSLPASVFIRNIGYTMDTYIFTATTNGQIELNQTQLIASRSCLFNRFSMFDEFFFKQNGFPCLYLAYIRTRTANTVPKSASLFYQLNKSQCNQRDANFIFFNFYFFPPFSRSHFVSADFLITIYSTYIA